MSTSPTYTSNQPASGGVAPRVDRGRATGYLISNSLKTATLLGAIGGLLVLIGSLLGGRGGAVIGLALGVLVSGVSYWFSDKIALRSAGAFEVTEAQAPALHRIVRDLTARAGLPMPKVCLIDEDQPNAFATGRNPRHAAVAVTRGLLEVCDEQEVAGVVAHELAHVQHRDILIASVAGAVATGISFMANMAMWFGAFGGGDDEDRANPLVLLVVALFAPLAASVLQMALSRSREFEADRGGAEILGDPLPLARALQKLEVAAGRIPADVTPAQASAYIVNPLTGRKVAFGNLFRTHPSTEERVARLLALR